jgi:hypothetical protein
MTKEQFAYAPVSPEGYIFTGLIEDSLEDAERFIDEPEGYTIKRIRLQVCDE